MSYEVTPLAYLARSRECLVSDRQQDLFYAAYELRCCVETRQADYLDALEKYQGVKVKGWKLGEVSRKLLHVWPHSKIARVTYAVRGKEFPTYFTPVPAELARAAEKELGGLLHAQRHSNVISDAWWERTRSRLMQSYRLAWVACRGEHMAPPLWGKKGQFHPARVYATPELEELFAYFMASAGTGEQLSINIEYLEDTPDDWQCDL